ADSGTTYTLESVSAVLTKAGSRYYDLLTGQPYNPASPYFDGPDFVLTGPDGRKWEIDAVRGITAEVRPNGARLLVSDTGIVAVGGPAVQFTTDTQGRLLRIQGPDGKQVGYEYTATGQLERTADTKTGLGDRYGY